MTLSASAAPERSTNHSRNRWKNAENTYPPNQRKSASLNAADTFLTRPRWTQPEKSGCT